MTFVLVDFPTALPAQCKICGSGVKTPLIDMGYSEEFYGAIYYCMECAHEICRVIGAVDKNIFDQLQRRFNDSEELLKILSDQLSSFETLNNALKGAGYEFKPYNVLSVNDIPYDISNSNVDLTHPTLWENDTNTDESSGKLVGSVADKNLGTVHTDGNSIVATQSRAVKLTI